MKIVESWCPIVAKSAAADTTTTEARSRRPLEEPMHADVIRSTDYQDGKGLRA
jgi:hypothetical protein